MNKGINVSELKPGQRVEALFSVKYKHNVKKYKNGYSFSFGVADKTGEIEVTYWGTYDMEHVDKIFNRFLKKEVVFVKGMVSEWNNKIKIDINPPDGDVTKVTESDYNIEDFIAVCDKDIDDMFKQFMAHVDSVNNTHLNKLLHSFFDDESFVKIYKHASAAMYMHQAYIGGLLDHTLNVTEICSKVCELYPVLDRDLLITGALLHDIGKVKEFEMSTNIRHSEQGMLIGHIVLGSEMLHDKIKKIPDFPELLKLKIVHMLLAHHGTGEFGSPKKPMLPEAEVLYCADDMDSKVFQYIKLRDDSRVTSDDFRGWNKYIGEVYLK